MREGEIRTHRTRGTNEFMREKSTTGRVREKRPLPGRIVQKRGTKGSNKMAEEASNKPWCDIPDARSWTRDAADHSGPIIMASFYYVMSKDGATSYLKNRMMELVQRGWGKGELRMMRYYKRHGTEQNKVVQITWEKNIEMELLSAMREEGMRTLPDE